MTTRIGAAISPRPGRRQANGRTAARRSYPTRTPLLAAAAVFLLLLVVWWYAGQWYESRLLLEQRAEVVTEVSARGSVLSSAINRRLARLQGLHAFVQTEGSEADFSETFQQFAADLYAGSLGIRNLAVAPDGVVQYVYPLAGNESVLGYQPMLDERPMVAADIRRAIETEEIVISGPLELLQGGLGLIARQAVFQDGSFWGLVNVVVDIDRLIIEAGLEGGDGELEFALRDQNGEVFFGSPSVFFRSPIVTQIFLPEGRWELAASPQEEWPALIQQPLLIARLLGMFIITLLASLVFLMINRQTRLAAAVEQRTVELSAANTLLEQRVEERTLELTILLNIARSIASTYALEDLLELVLEKLLPVIDYTGGAILTLEEGAFKLWAHRGQFPQQMGPDVSYSADNIIGQEIIRNRRPVLIPDVSSDAAEAAAFREAVNYHEVADHEDMADSIRSWMGIPLVANEQVIGMLALHHRVPDVYSQQSADLAMAFANQVAVAIENTRLHEKAQRLAVLQERQRLARDLHDSVSQALYGIALGSRTAQKMLKQMELNNETRAVLSEPIDYILELSEGGLAEMRALIFELRPESLESEGLAAALCKLAASLQARHRVVVTTLLESEPETPLATKEVLYRVSQEALNNIVKHAGAANCSIKLFADGDGVILEVKDNGKGFDPDGNFKGHLGLKSMRERVEQVGGTLTISSSADRGTELRAVVPLVSG